MPFMKQITRYFEALLLLMVLTAGAGAQDTLPRFTVQDKGKGRVVVSWSNPYPNLIQLAVQSSTDSLKRFGTVYSTTSPELPVNGFSDRVAEGSKVYYRIFYVMEGGSYFFTQSKQPVIIEETTREIQEIKVETRREILTDELQRVVLKDVKQPLAPGQIKREPIKELYDPNKPLYIKESDTSGFISIPIKDFRNYRDSIINKTKDTLVQVGRDTLFLKAYDPPYAIKTSDYVFTNKDGYIVIKLDDAEKKKYQLVLMEEDETPLIEIRQVKSPMMILDKTNFYHGGWYKYTLRESGRVKEKGKVYLPKDFRP